MCSVLKLHAFKNESGCADARDPAPDEYTLPSLWPILNSSRRNVVIIDVVIVEVNVLTVVLIVEVVVLSVVVVEVVLFVALVFGITAFVMFAIVVSVTIKVALI